MTSLLMKVALAAVLTIVSGLGLIAVSGSIIFADIDRPDPAALVQDAVSSGTKPMSFTGPTR
jgi:hypothetical protein